MKKIMLILSLLTMQSICNADSPIVNIKSMTSTQSKQIKKKNLKLINVWPSAIRACNDWCRGHCEYVQIDPNQGHLYRYVCSKK